ncbi:Concanavalin A-like lectin/glucanase [Metarhizium album ARSEF 1941]|uniref:Concanavalin A-like lectin/glucanase n=1 Tax=Metarhizium album (strain ARSEF 1941) TaxID=1081103 RepID=A0A0B2X3F5_METAS|nr:Concanavalin A-like lectin/glucanase [Metarhizium album ARSEF 1941]KHN99840.1 Concanavalin A-like lectin/glucanase [Metarhizium album ARSEF 1941]
MFRWLVNAILLAIPVGTTIAILLGLQVHNNANGRPPPFSGGDNAGDLPGVGIPRGKDGVFMKCDESFGFDPKSKGQNFILNPNPWGWKDGEPGALCMLVNVNGNRTYATDFSAPVFNVTWQYPRLTNGRNNVHAFPNAEVDNKKFPVQVGSVSKFELDVEWSLSLKNDTRQQVTEDDITANQINANVAVDMFMDKDSTKAGESTKAGFEVMVWLADFGTDAWPIGKTTAADKGLVKTTTLNGVEFELYAGTNAQQQRVLSWVATKPTANFQGNLKPLLDGIFDLNNANYPQKTDYLGYVAFGQEAYSSTSNVTFSVTNLAIDIETSA